MPDKTPTIADFYNSQPNVSANDVYGSSSDVPDVPDYSAGPGNKEGTYRMFPRAVGRHSTDKANSGGIYVPYSKVEDAVKGGYVLAPEDHPRWVADATWDSKGLPGGPWSRFGSSALGQLWGAAKGMYHGLVEGPQNPEEAAIYNDPMERGSGLRLHRFVTGPMAHEAQRTKEEYEKSGISPATVGHAVATAVPMLGPAVAQTTEQIGEQVRKGDLAGAGGTGFGFLAPFAIDELAGRVARSELVTKIIPEGMIQRLIRPMTADVRFGKDPVRAILEEKIVGNNLEDIGDTVAVKLGDVGRDIDRVAQNSTATVDASVALKPLDDAIAEAVKTGRRDLFKRLTKTREELYYEWNHGTTPRGVPVMRRGPIRNMQMTPYEATKFKRMVGDRIRWTQDPLDGEVNQALGASYGKVKDAINAKVPGLKELNQRYADLVGAKTAIERRAMVQGRNAHWSLGDIAIAASGHPVIAIGRKIATFPAVKTRLAQYLHNIPNKTPSVLPAVGITAAEGTVQHEPTKPPTVTDFYNSQPDIQEPDTGTQPSQFDEMRNTVASQQEVDPSVMSGLQVVENKEQNPTAINHNTNGTFDFGLMQINSATYRKMVDPTATDEQIKQALGDPEYNYQLAARIVKDAMSVAQTPQDIAAIYHTGVLKKDARGNYIDGSGQPITDYINRFTAALTPEEAAAPPEPAPLPQAKVEAQKRKPAAGKPAIKVTAPDGSEHLFQNQEAANQFKAAAGIQ